MVLASATLPLKQLVCSVERTATGWAFVMEGRGRIDFRCEEDAWCYFHRVLRMYP